MITWSQKNVPVDSLVPYERNPRTATDKEYQKLLRSLKRNGTYKPLVSTRDNRLLGGHLRLRALRELGYTEVAVSFPDADLTDEQFKEILISDNVHQGEYDIELLAADFTVMQLDEFGVDEQTIKAAHPDKKINKIIKDTPGYILLCEFDNEIAQQLFHSEMNERGIKCKLLS